MVRSLRCLGDKNRERENEFAHRIEGYETMKKGIHPKVRQVVFKDVSSDFSFLGTSTMDSTETIKWEDGKSYPLIKVEISSASHPFFTGKQRVLDTEGRIDRFKKKYGKK
jgi:large subunit ribosomal protein L31